MNKYYIMALMVGLLSMGYISPVLAVSINPAHRTCEKDADCSWIGIGCLCPCGNRESYDAVNQEYTEEYKKLRQCSEAELQQCAVMGACYNSEHPVAVCKNNQCAIDWKKDIPR